MFAEAFGLRQVYIPLQAYFEQKVKSEAKEINVVDRKEQSVRQVVELEPTILEWLKRADKDDAIRVICGGPGCGKSSFGRMLAAHLAEDETVPVLFVPLHQLDPSGDLVTALGDFLRADLDNILPPNPLESGNAERQVLLVFDGLDELAMQGKVAAQAAQDFVREVQKKLLSFNRSDARVFALLSGRDLAIQATRSEFRRDGQILHVLPYFLTESEKESNEYIDEQNLLQQGQRQRWWQTYGQLKGKNYSGLPDELNRGKLVEVTAQPLLNYLVALSYDRNEIDFSDESNLNTIYNDLLEQVYQRDWAGYQHPTLGNISPKDFIRILEEVAIACWHGNGRTTTVNTIEKRCASGNLKRKLEIFEGGASAGVTQLLTAFYFRQSGVQGSEATFEFTHKSFGEYLTARRIVFELRLIQDELERHRDNPDVGWDEKECLKRWAMLCGPTAFDQYLLSFLKDDIKQQPLTEVGNWQQTLCDLISYVLKQGMPMEMLDPRPNFFTSTKQARNATEALFAALSSCAWRTERTSNIQWPSKTAFGTLLRTLQEQRAGAESLVVLSCLNHLELTETILYFQDLYGASLDGASLDRASLDRASLHDISWNKETTWKNAQGLSQAKNVPSALKKHLGLK